MTVALVVILIGLVVVFGGALYLRGLYGWAWDEPEAPTVERDTTARRQTSAEAQTSETSLREQRGKQPGADQVTK